MKHASLLFAYALAVSYSLSKTQCLYYVLVIGYNPLETTINRHLQLLHCQLKWDQDLTGRLVNLAASLSKKATRGNRFRFTQARANWNRMSNIKCH